MFHDPILWIVTLLTITKWKVTNWIFVLRTQELAIIFLPQKLFQNKKLKLYFHSFSYKQRLCEIIKATKNFLNIEIEIIPHHGHWYLSIWCFGHIIYLSSSFLEWPYVPWPYKFIFWNLITNLPLLPHAYGLNLRHDLSPPSFTKATRKM